MANRGQIAGGVLGSVLAACAVAAPVIVQREGWVTKTYADPVAISTVCAGVTGARPGTYTDAQCEQMTAQALVQHGVAIAQCLPANLPTDTRAAFTSFAYNIGDGAFCKSRVARHANAGELPAACAALSLYVYAGGKQLPGLVARRAEERALCMKGLKP
jgi:lysozyme